MHSSPVIGRFRPVLASIPTGPGGAVASLTRPASSARSTRWPGPRGTGAGQPDRRSAAEVGAVPPRLAALVRPSPDGNVLRTKQTWYVPSGRFVNRYSPCESVVVVATT